MKVVSEKLNANVYIDEVRDWDLAKLKSTREKESATPQTIKHNFQCIRSAVNWAKDNGYVVKELRFPKIKLPKHRLHYLSQQEERQLLEELNPKRKRAYRPDYEFRSMEENRKYQASDEYVFTNSKGQPRGYQAKGIPAAFKRAGIHNFRIPVLRHTCASRMAQAGLSLYKIGNMLGHTDTSTTPIYAHLERRMLAQRRGRVGEGLIGITYQSTPSNHCKTTKFAHESPQNPTSDLTNPLFIRGSAGKASDDKSHALACRIVCG